jgi:hypothetical protein
MLMGTPGRQVGITHDDWSSKLLAIKVGNPSLQSGCNNFSAGLSMTCIDAK